MGDQPFMVSMCDQDGDQRLWEWEVDPFTRNVRVPDKDREELQSLLAAEHITKVFHNAKFDVRMLGSVGFVVCGPGGDVREGGRFEETTFMAHALNTLEPNYKLKDLARRKLGFANDDQKALQKAVQKARRIGKKQDWKLGVKLNGEPEPLADYWLPAAVWRRLGEMEAESKLCGQYCLNDAQRTMLLFLCMREALEGQPEEELTYDREIELWPTTYALEERGVRLHWGRLQACIEEHEARHSQYLSALKDYAGKKDFNPNSPPQVLQMLRRLQVPIQGGSADIDALKPYMANPAVSTLVKYRAMDKALGSFFYNYKRLATLDFVTGEGYSIHPSFQQVGPVTGRFACREPNLQNVANALTTRSPEPIQARKPFEPRPGYVWIHFDYDSMEVRIFADFSWEPVLVDACQRNLDQHGAVANMVWGGQNNPQAIEAAYHALHLDRTGETTEALLKAWDSIGIKARGFASLPPEKACQEAAVRWMKKFDWSIVDAEKSIDQKTCRAKAKMILFGKLYGGGPNAIMDLIGCSYEEAKRVMRQFDQRMPRIVSYSRELIREAHRNGFIRTAYGRRLSIDRDAAYRCVNYIVQGSSADQVKEAMRRLARWLPTTGRDISMVLTIHDELVFEVKKEHVTRGLLLGIKERMEETEGRFKLALPVSPAIVRTEWDLKKDFDLD